MAANPPAPPAPTPTETLAFLERKAREHAEDAVRWRTSAALADHYRAEDRESNAALDETEAAHYRAALSAMRAVEALHGPLMQAVRLLRVHDHRISIEEAQEVDRLLMCIAAAFPSPDGGSAK